MARAGGGPGKQHSRMGHGSWADQSLSFPICTRKGGAMLQLVSQCYKDNMEYPRAFASRKASRGADSYFTTTHAHRSCRFGWRNEWAMSLALQ